MKLGSVCMHSVIAQEMVTGMVNQTPRSLQCEAADAQVLERAPF